MKDPLTLDLFEVPPRIQPPPPRPKPGPRVRKSDPWTSHAAAMSVRETDLRLVLRAHARHPDGLTDFELADIVNRQQTSAGKRRGELRDWGYVEEAGYARPAPSGRAAMVWTITANGRARARTFDDDGAP